MQFFLVLLPLLLLPVPQERGDFEAWVDQLGADYQEEREEAGKNLEKAGKAAEPFLIEGVGHGDFRVRGSCITILSRLNSLAALDPVTAVFRNPREVKEVTNWITIIIRLSLTNYEPNTEQTSLHTKKIYVM